MPENGGSDSMLVDELPSQRSENESIQRGACSSQQTLFRVICKTEPENVFFWAGNSFVDLVHKNDINLYYIRKELVMISKMTHSDHRLPSPQSIVRKYLFLLASGSVLSFGGFYLKVCFCSLSVASSSSENGFVPILYDLFSSGGKERCHGQFY